MKVRIIFLLLGFSLGACTSSGPVRTLQADSEQVVVTQPSGFKSPIEELDLVWAQVGKFEDRYLSSRNAVGHWSAYAGWLQVYDTLEADQVAIEEELSRTGEVILEPGRSYSFELESYCVMPGIARPVRGDGLRVAPVRGPAKSWIFEVLKQQGKKRLPQERVQYLIWALLADVRYDELSEEDQATLLEFYPDARIRFGDRRLENAAKDLLEDFLPPSVSDSLQVAEGLREQVLDFQGRYEDLSEFLAPIPERVEAIPVGWLRMREGYFLKATSESYDHIRLDVYVPMPAEREPSAARVFRPWQWIAMPEQGQRVAVSVRSVRKKRSLPKTACDRARAWKPKDCRELSEKLRRNILEIANPKNFPQTRYQLPPLPGSKGEEATDCSHFVHEIFGRVGLAYDYQPTQTLRCLQVFDEVADQPRAGDLILYPGHVGIFDGNGNVISATRGGRQPRERSRLDPGDPDFISAITRYPVETFGNGKVLRWRCP